jgi:peptidoglycan hydrolase CwlO-like protein
MMDGDSCYCFIRFTTQIVFGKAQWRCTVKKTALAFVSILLLCSGCASQGYVKQQTDQLACSIEILESKAATLESRVQVLESRANTLEAQVSALPQTLELAPADRETLRTALDSAQRADASAASAAASATAAEQSAQRAAKAFELGQKK